MVLVVYRLTGAMSGVVMYVFMGNDLVYVNMTCGYRNASVNQPISL